MHDIAIIVAAACARRRRVAAVFIVALLCVAFGSASARTLERGNGPEPDTLDAHRTQTIAGFNVLRDVYEGLVTEDATGAIVPGLAEAWTVSPDGLTWRFRLRANLKWSDGAPFDATHVVASFRRALDPATAAPYASVLADIAGADAVIAGTASPDTLAIRATDKGCVEIVLARPAPLLKLLVLPIAYPVNVAAATRDGARHTRPGQLVGTGAYRLVAWQPQASIELERNPHFHGVADVAIDRVRHHVTEDAANEMKRFLAGDLDITETVPPGRLAPLRERFGDALRIAPYVGTFWFGFNLRHAPFADAPALREALVLAIDRRILTEHVTALGETPAFVPVPPGIGDFAGTPPAYASWTQAEREARARALYAQAGYGADRPLAVELRYNTSTQHRRLSLAVAAMWRQVLGVKTTLRNEEWKVFVANRRMGTITQVFRGGWIADYDDAASFLATFAGDQPLNTTGYVDATFDDLVARARREPDAATRASLFDAAQSRLVAAHAIVPVYHYASKHLVRDDVLGFAANPLDRHATRWLRFAPDAAPSTAPHVLQGAP